MVTLLTVDGITAHNRPAISPFLKQTSPESAEGPYQDWRKTSLLYCSLRLEHFATGRPSLPL